MMINQRVHPTVEVPPWDPPYEDPTADSLHNFIISPQTKAYFSALRQYLPSSGESGGVVDSVGESDADEFRMYEFKVRRCTRVRSHDWTECPYAHPGEKARRRDPRRRSYSATPCPEFRRGSCRKGDACEFAHGVFECWLHPARYRTQPCNDGPLCRRRVCFFAHTPSELRLLNRDSPGESDSPPVSPSYGGGNSLVRGLKNGSHICVSGFGHESDSPPVSPSYGGGNSVAELVGGMRGLQLGSGARICGSGFGMAGQMGYMGMGTGSGLGRVDPYELEEEVTMERVESGKGIRESMYAKLCKENSLDWGRVDSASPGPDFGWVSELVN